MKKTNTCDDKKSNQLTLKQHENLQKSTKSSAEQMPNSLNDTFEQRFANRSKASLEKWEVGHSELKRIIDAYQKRQKASTEEIIQLEDLEFWEDIVITLKLLGMNIQHEQEEYAETLRIIKEESVTIVQEIQEVSAAIIKIKQAQHTERLLQEQNARIAKPIKALLQKTSKNTKSYQQKVTPDKKLADIITRIQEQSEKDIKNNKKIVAAAKKMIKEDYAKTIQIMEAERTLITQEIKLMEERAADTKNLCPHLLDKFKARLKDWNGETVTKMYKKMELTWNSQRYQPQEESKEPPKTAIGYNASNAKVSSLRPLQQDTKLYNAINKLIDSQKNINKNQHTQFESYYADALKSQQLHLKYALNQTSQDQLLHIALALNYNSQYPLLDNTFDLNQTVQSKHLHSSVSTPNEWQKLPPFAKDFEREKFGRILNIKIKEIPDFETWQVYNKAHNALRNMFIGVKMDHEDQKAVDKAYNQALNGVKDSRHNIDKTQHNLVATTQKASSQLDGYQSFLKAEQSISDPIDPQDNMQNLGSIPDFYQQ